MEEPAVMYFALVCAENIVFSASNNARYTLYILLNSFLFDKVLMILGEEMNEWMKICV